jgi:hypothetical protein
MDIYKIQGDCFSKLESILGFILRNLEVFLRKWSCGQKLYHVWKILSWNKGGHRNKSFSTSYFLMGIFEIAFVVFWLLLYCKDPNCWLWKIGWKGLYWLTFLLRVDTDYSVSTWWQDLVTQYNHIGCNIHCNWCYFFLFFTSCYI